MFETYYYTTPNITVFGEVSRQIALPMYTFINYCFFSHLIANEGGAIFSQNVPLRSLIENCMFFACRSSGKGGAVCIYNPSDASSVFNYVCANNCSSNVVANGQSLYVVTSNLLYNYFMYVSVVKCGLLEAPGYHSFTIQGGKQLVKNVNSSNNKIKYQGTGITIWDGNQTSVSYSNFGGGSSSSGNCYNIQPCFTTHYCSNCNIFNNTCYYTIIWGYYANAEFTGCIFSKNSNPLALIQGGSLIIKSCWSDSYLYSISNTGTITIYNTISVSSFIDIQHFSTYHCQTNHLVKTSNFNFDLRFNSMLLVILYL